MDSNQFSKVFDDLFGKSAGMLVNKAKEYATDDDRLANFKKAANLQGITPEEALAGMMAKHTVSINDMISKGDPKLFSEAQWDEKILDHINYLILLKALVLENLDNGVPA